MAGGCCSVAHGSTRRWSRMLRRSQPEVLPGKCWLAVPFMVTHLRCPRDEPTWGDDRLWALTAYPVIWWPATKSGGRCANSPAHGTGEVAPMQHGIYACASRQAAA